MIPRKRATCGPSCHRQYTMRSKKPAKTTADAWRISDCLRAPRSVVGWGLMPYLAASSGYSSRLLRSTDTGAPIVGSLGGGRAFDLALPCGGSSSLGWSTSRMKTSLGLAPRWKTECSNESSKTKASPSRHRSTVLATDPPCSPPRSRPASATSSPMRSTSCGATPRPRWTRSRPLVGPQCGVTSRPGAMSENLASPSVLLAAPRRSASAQALGAFKQLAWSLRPCSKRKNCDQTSGRPLGPNLADHHVAERGPLPGSRSIELAEKNPACEAGRFEMPTPRATAVSATSHHLPWLLASPSPSKMCDPRRLLASALSASHSPSSVLTTWSTSSHPLDPPDPRSSQTARDARTLPLSGSLTS
mmetsp:Transcript_54353/g.123911  ORF Transcript_54353/g.123911 Transcript_54353/m.123911 type:complete len:360 (+) Transcript_54353:196-1275(+)